MKATSSVPLRRAAAGALLASAQIGPGLIEPVGIDDREVLALGDQRPRGAPHHVDAGLGIAVQDDDERRGLCLRQLRDERPRHAVDRETVAARRQCAACAPQRNSQTNNAREPVHDYPTAFAAARPALRPENRHPPRNVPFQRAVAVHAAAAKTGGFADGVEPRDDLAILAEHAGIEIGLKTAERLAGEDVEFYRDQRPVRGIEDPMRLCGADQPVADILARIVDVHHLRVLDVRICQSRGRAPRSAP